jgi:hypothetical protein
MIFDYIVVGSGPSSLSFVQTAIKANKNLKMLIIERTEALGGCHSARYENGYFYQHSPVIYSTKYKNFRNLLKEMGTDFYDLFTLEKKNTIVQFSSNNSFTFFDLIKITIALVLFLVYDWTNDMSVGDFTQKYKFSKRSSDLMDKICRVSNGVNADRETLYNFLQVIQSQFTFDSFAHPKIPNDIGLFKIWKEYLMQKNVKFILNTEIVKCSNTSTSCTLFDKFGNTFNGKVTVFAIPPKSICKIFNTLEMVEYSKKTSYNDYITIVYHFLEILNVKNNVNNIATDTEWGISFVILSDYTKFDNPRSKTVISTSTTIFDKPFNGKLPNECTESELKYFVFLQIKKLLGFTQDRYTAAILNKDMGSAFIKAKGTRYHDWKLNTGVYWVGTQNGKSSFPVTSVETAVTNGIALANELVPRTSSNSLILFLICLVFGGAYVIRY